MRIADIKCFCKGTNTGSFLQESEYSGVLESLSALPSDLETQKETLKAEMNGGGLDASALNLGGFSPLFEMGYTANNNISNANQSIDEVKEIIKNDAKAHLANEWGKYYQEVHKCTEEKKTAMDSAASYYNGLKDSDPNKDNAYSAYESAKSDYEKHVAERDNASSKYESYAGGSASEALSLDFEEMAANAASPTTAKSSGYNSDGSAAQETQASIYDELSALGYSRAGICAILANMQQESAFDLNAVGDGGTSYGLCQWHDSRWTNLNNFCAQNGLDPSTVKGQIAFLDYELKTNYPGFYEQLQNADDSQATAENLARIWCTDFERPAEASLRAEERAGNVSTYWERSEGAISGASVINNYSHLSAIHEVNNKKTQAVKEREFDTTASSGQSTESQEVAYQIGLFAAENCPGTYGWCAAGVETAITAVTGVPTSGNAKDLLWNGSLESAGYVRQTIDPTSSDYQPLPGDVVVCGEGYNASGGYSTYGHAQVYTPYGWYSDHKQDSMYIYSNEVVLYRYEGSN